MDDELITTDAKRSGRGRKRGRVGKHAHVHGWVSRVT